jgi:hypothetical protein
MMERPTNFTVVIRQWLNARIPGECTGCRGPLDHQTSSGGAILNLLSMLTIPTMIECIQQGSTRMHCMEPLKAQNVAFITAKHSTDLFDFVTLCTGYST